MGRFGPHDVVVDVQNAIPFFSPLYCGRPVVVLVHHVHGNMGHDFSRRTSRIGWWVESRLAPWLYRHASYVTVSEASRGDLAGLGVERARVEIVHNGAPAPARGAGGARTLQTVDRLPGAPVPHKRIEFVSARLRISGPSTRSCRPNRGQGPGNPG
jgi:hypothetical protein